MAVDIESSLVMALDECRCVFEGITGDLSVTVRDEKLLQLQTHLQPLISDAELPWHRPADICQQLTAALWNLCVSETFSRSTAVRCHQLAADLLLLFGDAGDASRPHRLPLDTAERVLLTAAADRLDSGEFATALRLVTPALCHVAALQAAAERQLASFNQHSHTLRQLCAAETARRACHALRAQVLFGMDDKQAAADAVSEALASCTSLKDVAGDQLVYLQQMLFNFGLSCYQRGLFTQAAEWLERSGEVGGNVAASLTVEGLRPRTLELLARCHMQLGTAKDLNQASQFLQLAFSESSSLTLRLLILECVLRGETAAGNAVEHCIQDAKDWCRTADDQVMLSDLLVRFGLRVEACSNLQEHVSAALLSPRVHTKLLQLHLHDRRLDDAVRLVTEYSARLKLGDDRTEQGVLALWEMLELVEQQTLRLLDEDRDVSAASEVLKQLCALAVEATGEVEAVDSSGDCRVAARIHRNLARCLWRQHGRSPLADRAVATSLRYEPRNPAGSFLQLRAHIADGSTQQALQLIHEAGDGAGGASLWRHLCGYALCHQMSAVYTALLDAVLRSLTESGPANLVLVQCLVRSRCEPLEVHPDPGLDLFGALIEALKLALNCLQHSSDYDVCEKGCWLSDVAWNAATLDQAAPSSRYELFWLSQSLRAAVSQELPDLSLCRTATVMSAAAQLEASRVSNLSSDLIQSHYRNVLQCVTECGRISDNLGSAAAGWAYQKTLLLYELEAQAGLDSGVVDGVCDTLLRLCAADSDTATLQQAALLTARAGRLDLALRVWNASISRLLSAPDENGARIASLYVRCLSTAVSSVSCQQQSADQLLQIMTQMCDVIRRAEVRLPNMTVLYLMCGIWNQSVKHRLQQDSGRAQRWAEVALSLVGSLAAQNDWYSHHMHKCMSTICTNTSNQ